jgi:hypothetical protein
VFALLPLCCLAAPAAAPPPVDYATIDRTIKKEPFYYFRKPAYALLVFGPQAKVRIWVVKAGDTVFIDRNGDGDLTGSGEKFASFQDVKDIEIADPDGKTRYVITSAGVNENRENKALSLMVNVDVIGPVKYRQYCDVTLADGPGTARVAHFHGPLTIGPRTINFKIPEGSALKLGDDPTDLTGYIGTMGEKAGCWVVVCSESDERNAIPKDKHPVVDIEFPPKKPGSPTIKKRYFLEKRC